MSRSAWWILTAAGAALWLVFMVRINRAFDETQAYTPDSSAAVAGEAGVEGAAVQGVEGGSETGGSESSPGSGDGGCINVNTADAKALIGLPGIGEVIAGRIIAYREENGPFAKPSALLAVKGIGTARLEKISDRICF